MTQMNGDNAMKPYVLAFDTANEVVAVGVGLLNATTQQIAVVASVEIAAHRASNTTLLPTIDGLLQREGIAREEIACVCYG